MRSTVAALSLASLAMAAPAKRASPAPVHFPRGELVADNYIIKLNNGVAAAALDDALSLLSSEAKFRYNSANFKGFAAHLDAATLEALQNHPDVDFIEQDAVVSINAYTTQSGADWGLARISHESGTNGYTYDTSAGSGTCAYIIDTGIYVEHSDFDGRATWAANFVDNDDTDGNGHGTHCAGTVGGTTYGVAKETSLYAVKVLNANGSGTNSGVIAGMNFVSEDMSSRSCPNGVVANMSLGGSYSATVNSAAAAMVSDGVFLAVAAGNDGENASNSSPASESTVCTVGATTEADRLASYSNYGALVDILAPGSSIESDWIGSKSATNTISGTSMATPHITGLGAYLLALEGSRTPAALCSRMGTLATKNAISGVPSSTDNYLAFNGNPSG